MSEGNVPRPPLQNPIPGTTILTNPQALGLHDSQTELGRSKSLLGRSMDKLSRSTSSIGHSLEKLRRSPSDFLRRKDRDDASSSTLGSSSSQRQESSHLSTAQDLQQVQSTDAPPVATTVDLKLVARSAHSAGPSPRKTPSLDRMRPARPSINAFRGDGSLRAGTQTLIQALQAIPWADEDGNEDGLPESVASDPEDTDAEANFTMTSSIHTIHRPVARMRRLTGSPQASPIGPSMAHIDSDQEQESPDEMEEAEDFEIGPAPGITVAPSRPTNLRSQSLATVKLQRRGKLAQKLRDVFGLDDIEEVLAEMPCWLLRSILLQGYMYLTNAHLCFFAHLPTDEDQVLKSGTLSKRGSRTKRWNKYWFILKNDVLSWYQSSADPYFPHGNLDLRYAVTCEPVGERGFRIRTNQRNVNLMADSVPSREEWVKAVRKVMFRAQNTGESVKIAIPFSLIVDVDKNTWMDFTETIEVKVFDRDDKDDNYSLDSYFFAYFHDLDRALDQIQDILGQHRRSASDPSSRRGVVQDTTSTGVVSSIGSPDRPAQADPRSTSFRLTSLLRPFSSHTPPPLGLPARTESAPEHIQDIEIVGSPPPRLTASPSPLQDDSRTLRPGFFRPSTSSPDMTPQTSSMPESSASHIYPPSWSPSPGQHQQTLQTQQDQAGKGWSVPHWLRGSSRLFTPGQTGSDTVSMPQSMILSDHASDDDDDRAGSNTMGFSLLDGTDVPHLFDNTVAQKFHSTFALDEKEALIGYLPGSLLRVLPIYGRVYISVNYFCFRSTQPLTKTRMIIPIRDIISVEKQRAFSLRYHGLAVVIKGHEELFLEFSSAERRDACIKLLDSQMDVIRQKELTGPTLPTQSQKDSESLEELEPTSPALELEIPHLDAGPESAPPVMFTSTSSTFLTFKPQEPLRFTFLTIGSRGDVQPYIALGKGLLADGHHVKIATHAEFKSWIEGHGIEHAYVGGDPAELMRICVENGMFTFSFMKEGLQKFRGWIDDLLKTSWEACQGSDVLVESPSAMAGIHIAEALGIPYFRAFTMPWSRTRAYPHAFAVPDHKMGGSYNYITYVMFDQVFWRAISGQINRWRRHTLSIDSTNLDKLEQHKVPFLYNFSPTVVPPPLDWYEWIRVTGYWFLDDPDNSQAKKWEPPKDLVRFIDSARADGRKLVYIGFGSIVVSDPDAMTQCVVQAIEHSGVRAILSKGWSDRLSSKKDPKAVEKEHALLPSTIYPISSIPHDWLFARIDAACHHGGAGTTGASLRAGIPTIIKPFFGDQFFWADRVEALGIGSSVRKLTVDSLTEALRNATTDERQISRAKLVGQKIRSERGVANAIEALYRDMEYARSLVKRHRAEGEEHLRASAITEGTSLADIRDGSQDSSSSSARGTSDDWEAVSYSSAQGH
ncbi:glycosyltransferase family 1 protein [Calocera viscosa TUFC12733]|uniref:sterol 3beta-glucosyltransferase n=1 Tax=Calocera viscosa (strain TUFC12733) TaxID=1330018 RepID=A0A167RC18_CALVF|nr:glycosyltransferase family 1 protein [Calocera viscosa TUFC12733]